MATQGDFTSARIFVPTELWQRFRAEAILRGLSIGEALAEAIGAWLAFPPRAKR